MKLFLWKKRYFREVTDLHPIVSLRPMISQDCWNSSQLFCLLNGWWKRNLKKWTEWHPNWKKSCQPFLSWVEVPSSGGHTSYAYSIPTYPTTFWRWKSKKQFFLIAIAQQNSQKQIQLLYAWTIHKPRRKELLNMVLFPGFHTCSFSSAHHRCCCLLSSEEQTHWTLQAPSKNEDWLDIS